MGPFIELTILREEIVYYLLEMVEQEALTVVVEKQKTECINRSSMNSEPELSS